MSRLPGTGLRATAARLCGPHALARLIDPVIADLQHEYAEASRDGHAWRRHRARLLGAVAVGRVLTWHVSRQVVRALHGHATGQDDGVGRRTMAAFGVAFTIVVLLIDLPPLRYLPEWKHASYATLIVLLLAQAVPLALPAGVLAGLLWGAGGRQLSRASLCLALLLALAGSVAMYAHINWVIPVSNQAFRVAVIGHDVPRGTTELTLSELRERMHQATAAPPARLAVFGAQSAPELAYQLHSREAISCATFLFALFALAVLRRHRAARILLGTMAGVLYLGYYFGLGPGTVWLLRDYVPPAVMAWLPNLAIAAASFSSFAASSRLQPSSEI
jgi:hypothetical protein